jgi:lipopolysaccharide transport protein LptA
VRWCTDGRRRAGARRPIAALLLAAAPIVTAAGAATASELPAGAGCTEPLCYTASTLEAERNHMVMHDINIVDTSRGVTHIKADMAEANGADLANSEWVLTGHVQVSLPQGKLTADKATVRFANKRITSMSAEGAPAEFEHSADAAAGTDAANRGHGPIDAVHGHAHDINYDLEHDLLKLSGDSWLTDGCNEISSQSIVYDIANQKVRADATPGGDTQVHGTLHARAGPQCNPSAAKP